MLEYLYLFLTVKYILTYKNIIHSIFWSLSACVEGSMIVMKLYVVYYKKVVRRATNAFDCMNVTITLNNHQHVLATHVATFRVIRKRIQLQL
jgi:hypothetical protein